MKAIHYWYTFIGFAILSAFMLSNHLFPIHLLTPFYGDYGQMVWNLWSVWESIEHGKNPYFSDLIFHPEGSLLAKHTLAMGFFPITGLVKFISNDSPLYPFISMKIIILLSFTLLCFFTYLTLKELNYNKLAAIIPAIGYGFCNFYMLHWMHLNHISGFFIPLTAWLVIRFSKRPSLPRAIAVSMIVAISIYFTEFSLFIILALLFYGLMALIITNSKQKNHINTLLKKTNIGPIIICIATFTIIATPFLINFRNHETLTPSKQSISGFSMNALSPFIPTPETTPLYGQIFSFLNKNITKGVNGQESFIGFPLLLLGIIGFIYRKHAYQKALALTGIAFYILSLGPTLKILTVETLIPLPYQLLSYIPIFQSFRTPARFVVIAYFCLALLSAEGFKQIDTQLNLRLSVYKKNIITTLFLLWTLLEVYSPIAPLPVLSQPSFPTLPPGPVLNVPIDINDGYALALQIFHKHPITLASLARFNLKQVQRAETLNRWLQNYNPKLCEYLKKDNYSMILILSSIEKQQLEFLSTCKIPVIIHK